MNAEKIHIIPVGFDYERLIQPISQGSLEADRVMLLYSSTDTIDTEAQKLAARMVEKLADTFQTVLGITVNQQPLDDIFKFENMYPAAYDIIQDEINKGNEVWVNISSMPRTAAFAFATASNSLIVEEPDLRDRIHTYYVSPKEYLVISMIKELREELDFLEDLVEDNESSQAEKRLESIRQLVTDIEKSGTTKGARKRNGGLHVELPVIPPSDLHEFEERVLLFLERVGSTESTSELARQLSREIGEKSTNSFKSKVQYNVKQLEKKGFVNRTEVKNKHRTEISTMGQLWVETHRESNSNVIPV